MARPEFRPLMAAAARLRRAAIRLAGEQLRSVRDQIPSDTPAEIAEFIDTHMLMLEDKALEFLVSEAKVEETTGT